MHARVYGIEYGKEDDARASGEGEARKPRREGGQGHASKRKRKQRPPWREQAATPRKWEHLRRPATHLRASRVMHSMRSVASAASARHAARPQPPARARLRAAPRPRPLRAPRAPAPPPRGAAGRPFQVLWLYKTTADAARRGATRRRTCAARARVACWSAGEQLRAA